MATRRGDGAIVIQRPGFGLNYAQAALLIKPPPWMRQALCSQTDPEAFFPERGGTTAPAKAICDGCSVAAECADYALANDERFGIWGGLSERERRKIKRLMEPA